MPITYSEIYTFSEVKFAAAIITQVLYDKVPIWLESCYHTVKGTPPPPPRYEKRRNRAVSPLSRGLGGLSDEEKGVEKEGMP